MPAVKDLTYIPIIEATRPTTGECLTDRWWIVHPEKGLAIWKGFSPQCNRDRAIGDSLIKHYPGHEVRHFAVVYLGNHVRRD